MDPGPIDIVNNQSPAKDSKCCKEKMQQEHKVGGEAIGHVGKIPVV